jgi:hypothetical protein
MRYPIWKTKDGQKIPVNKMLDSHLLNVLFLLKRYAMVRYENACLSVGNMTEMVSGEQAQYAAEAACNDLFENEDWTGFVPLIFWQIQTEARRRDLKFEYVDRKEARDGKD